METEQKAEKVRTKKAGETTPATAKANGKPKIKKNDSNSQIHKSNGAKSKSKSSEDQRVEVSGAEKIVLVDHRVQAPPESNGIDASKKKKKGKEKTKKEAENNKKKMSENSLLYQIPMSRVSRIIKSEDPNVRITQEAVYVINKASEKFLQVFATEAYANAFLDRNKCIDYKHLFLTQKEIRGCLKPLMCFPEHRSLISGGDFVPEKVKAEDALIESQAVEY